SNGNLPQTGSGIPAISLLAAAALALLGGSAWMFRRRVTS
ncbi:MAG TPA: LPXTG cell wall anchor domain-containing protein, partial [Candidatus Agrococcus pullicola]|nr:LPXTG cell wall anchor domain-containing protein [Candidatus Agrococcus pullicola]